MMDIVTERIGFAPTAHIDFEAERTGFEVARIELEAGHTELEEGLDWEVLRPWGVRFRAP